MEIVFQMMQDEGNTQLIIFQLYTSHEHARAHGVSIEHLDRLKETPCKDRVLKKRFISSFF